MAPVKEKQRRSQEESYRRRDTSMSRLLFSCSSRLRIRIEDASLSCKYLHLVFASALCFVICCAGKMRPCSDDGDKFVQLLFCVTHIPRRPLRPSATRTLRSWRDIPDWKKVVCPKIRAFPKSQEFPPPLSETSGIWVDILDSKDSGVAIRI